MHRRRRREEQALTGAREEARQAKADTTPVNVDDRVFGVAAMDAEGHERSITASVPLPPNG